MTRVKHISIVVIATVALVGVLAVPASAAAAKADETPDIVFRSHPVNSPASATPLVETGDSNDSSGFDWGAASIGAGTALGLGGLLSGAVLFHRRRQRPVTHTTATVWPRTER
jgi:uncharacterized protein (TIGR03382 family)